MPKVPMPLSILLSGTLFCGACVNAPPIATTPSACSELLPTEWLKGVAGVDLPDFNSVGELGAAFDGQTAKLDVANDRYISGFGIVRRCEERDAKAVKASRSKFLGLF